MKLFADRAVPITALAFLFFGAQLAYAQTSRIQGHVMDKGRRPVAELNVELLNEVEAVVMRTKTNGSGGYAFGNLPPGRYFIRVRTFGTPYEEQTQEVEINTFIGGRQVADFQQRDFYLKDRKDSERRLGPPGVIFAQDVPPDARRHFDQAVERINSNQLELGIEELRSAVSAFPDYFLALELLGLELLKQQKCSEAVPYFERAVAINDKAANGWFGLSFCYYSTEAGRKAVEAAKKAAGLNPESAEVALILGMAQRKEKQFIDAERSLLRAKKLSDGKSPDVHWNLALLYAYNLKNYRLAAIELEAYLKLKPDHPDAPLLKKLIQQYRNQG